MKKEFQAALQYVLMGAHFAQDSVNLSGLSEMFFEHAAEERQHGVKFMQYLRWRGDKDNSFLGRDVRLYRAGHPISRNILKCFSL